MDKKMDTQIIHLMNKRGETSLQSLLILKGKIMDNLL